MTLDGPSARAVSRHRGSPDGAHGTRAVVTRGLRVGYGDTAVCAPVDLAVDACRTLVEEPAGEVLLHQDLHGGNVLRSGADEWLAIDPKPLVGDPAFDAASLLRDRRWLLGGADDARLVRRRLDVLAEVTGLDRERMRRWGIVHALAWGVSAGRADADMILCAELLLRA